MQLNCSFRFTVLIDGRARSSSAWSSKTRNFIPVTKKNQTINNKISEVDSESLGVTMVMMMKKTPG